MSLDVGTVATITCSCYAYGCYWIMCSNITIHTVPNYIFPNIVKIVMTVKWGSYSPYWPYDLWKRYEVADINLEMFIKIEVMPQDIGHQVEQTLTFGAAGYKRSSP